MSEEKRPARRPEDDALFADVSRIIDTAREHMTTTVNSTLTMLHWSVGSRIREDVLGFERAEYGKSTLRLLADRLTMAYGRGYQYSALTRMVRLAELYPDHEIVSTLSRQLSWSHFTQLIALDDELERRFYTIMASRERWSVRTLRKQIDSLLFRRTIGSTKTNEEVAKILRDLESEGGQTLEATFRDPYVLDFLGLPEQHTEADLEDALVRDIERFLLELGGDFTFVARQKRITVDTEDYHLDLLFFHRNLRRLVAVELKTDKLRPEHKGQMELYLRWLDRYERRLDEEPPVGLILCTEKGPQQVELLALDQGDIRAAAHLTDALPKAALERHLKALAEGGTDEPAS